jgi:hypothetical protein
MHFYPRNRYLYIEALKEEKVEDSGIRFVLPDDYKRKNGPLQCVKLLKASDGSSYVSDEGNILLVSSHVIETIEVDNQIISIVPEHAVYGVMVNV